MKNKSIILTLATLLLLACDSDLEKVRYNASTAQPAILDAIDEAYTLEAAQSGETAITFEWKKPVIDYAASVTTDLQMDVQGKDFANAVTLASTKTDSTYAANTGDLNSALIKLQEKYGLELEATKVDFRLVSSISAAASPLYSNVVSTLITPFEEEGE